MAVYHQMGHHSNNLIDLPAMSAFAGAIFSPINCSEEEMAEQVTQAQQGRKGFEIVFDPQLYVPSTERGKLRQWSYFPKDVDSGDLASSSWWRAVNEKLVRACRGAGANAICSPVVVPKVFDDKYYSGIVRVCSDLSRAAQGKRLAVLQTALVSLAELSGENRALEIASIVSRTEADRAYLVFLGTTEPRRELVDVDELKGAMKLISALEQNEMPVLVGFCSSDVILWKAAGASACASGKFFNLRRFTRQRFEEPKESGGGQLPYWFEEGLLAFLRQGDLIRVKKREMLSDVSLQNPFGKEILAILDQAAQTRTKPKPWLASGWRQFLYWFSDVEGRLSRGESATEMLLETADANWTKLDKAKVLLEERPNDGTWVRSWLNALREFEES